MELQTSDISAGKRSHRSNICSRTWTKCEKILLLITILLSTVLILSIVSLIITHFEHSESQVCLTPVCIKAASEILNSIDETINPCNDFYQFSCANWIKSTTIPEETGSTKIIQQSNERLQIELRRLIENANESMPAYALVKNYYQSCMNLTAIDTYSLDLLRETLHELGDWPVVVGSDWDNSTFDWIEVMSKIREMGLNNNIFMQFKVQPNFENNSQYNIQIFEPVLNLRRQIITQGFNNTIVKVYHKLMVETALLIGGKNQTRIEEEMWTLIEFEKEIAKATYDISSREEILSGNLRLGVLINLTSIENSEDNETEINLFDSINSSKQDSNEEPTEEEPRLGNDWIRLLNAVLKINDTIHENETIYVNDLTYITFIDSMIAYLNLGNRRILANYILWQIAFRSLSDGSKRMRDLKSELNRHLLGVTAKKPRWKECILKIPFLRALSSLYIEDFDEQKKISASKIMDFMHQELERTLSNAEWMDQNTKNNAFRKSKIMKFIVGYIEEVKNHTLINESYNKLILSKDNYEKNNRIITKWIKDNEYSNLRKKNDPHSWRKFTKTAVVNAYYHQSSNAAFIPAGILRDVFFDPERPNYLNFGSIGFILGHEIIHSLDDSGAKFDEFGNYRNWWLNSTEDEYNNKIRCFIKQYDEYKLQDGLKINGNFTLGENIADNGGVKIAFNAYINFIEQFGDELMLPGVKYTPKQLFWISLAKNWCSKYTNEAYRADLDTDDHSPSRARINIPLSNFEEFGKSFDCKLGSNMNPINKCVVW